MTIRAGLVKFDSVLFSSKEEGLVGWSSKDQNHESITEDFKFVNTYICNLKSHEFVCA